MTARDYLVQLLQNWDEAPQAIKDLKPEEICAHDPGQIPAIREHLRALLQATTASPEAREQWNATPWIWGAAVVFLLIAGAISSTHFALRANQQAVRAAEHRLIALQHERAARQAIQQEVHRREAAEKQLEAARTAAKKALTRSLISTAGIYESGKHWQDAKECYEQILEVTKETPEGFQKEIEQAKKRLAIVTQMMEKQSTTPKP